MVKKQFEIVDTATFAWDPTQPILATGTLSGALDDTFSNTSVLKLYAYNHSSILGQVNSNSRFNKLAWCSNDVIAGGLEDGTLSLWQSQAIINKKDSALLLNSSIHTGPINSLEGKGHLLASASNEVYIWDLNKQDPFIVTKQLVNNLSWNGQVQHIIAMGLSNKTVIWDLRNKREVMSIPTQATSVVWNPDQTTQLVTSSDNAMITCWDLRHIQASERTMSGHTDGILDLSWCRQDSDLLLSCGKDGKTLIWNPNSGEALGEVTQHLNWAFKTSWCPCQPDLLASASYDGKIQVFSLQTESEPDDPFSAALDISKPTLKRPPKWFRRPIGATFAFGGKLVIFNTSRKIKTTTVVTETDVVQRVNELENALVGQLDTLVEKYEETDDSWRVIRSLLLQNPREQLASYLGFEKEKISGDIDKFLGSNKPLESILSTEKKKNLNKVPPEPIPSNDSDFFTQIQKVLQGQFFQDSLKLNSEEKSDIDNLITRAAILGDFESTVNLCLYNNQLSDALLFAIHGGKQLLEKTQEVYFQRTSSPYVSLLKSLMTNDLGHLVNSVPLEDWRSALVSLCTYATPEEFGPLCDRLGQRLESLKHKEALVCYLSSKNIEKVCSIWLSNFTANVKMDLQRTMEKVATFVKVIGFKDKDLEKTEKKLPHQFPLSPLYDLYYEYASFLASQGKLVAAMYYLNQIPQTYHKFGLNQLAILRDRVYNASPELSIRQIQVPLTPYGSKPIMPAYSTVQHSAYTPAASPMPKKNHVNTNVYTPVNSDSYSNIAYSPKPNNSYTPSKSTYSPNSNYTQASNMYGATANYVSPNNNYTASNYNYSTNSKSSNPAINYSPQTSSNYTHSSIASTTTAATTATTNYRPASNYPAVNTYSSTLAANTYNPSSTYNYSPRNNYQLLPSTPTYSQYTKSPYSPKIPAPPPVINPPSAYSATATTMPRPTAFHDPPMLSTTTIKSPKRNTTPVKRVMSPFPNQNINYQNNYSSSPLGSPQPKNVLPPPPMNASAPAPLSRQKTPTLGYYQSNQKIN